MEIYMTKNMKIGWQKYEDYIEKQLSCPLLQNIVQNMIMQHLEMDEDSIIEADEEDDEEDDEDYLPKSITKKSAMDISKILPITPEMIEDVSVLANFECWIAHTNFDVTNRVKEQLNKVPGVEILNVLSRYRFFIGVGQMFDFQEVRSYIEQELVQGD
jgi:hypothetical protein